MPDRATWADWLKQLYGDAQDLDALVKDGVTLKELNGKRLSLGSPNYEDPRLRLDIPARDPRKPNVSWTFGADLNWHDPLKNWAIDTGKRLLLGGE